MDKLNKLENLLKIVQDSVTQEEFLKSFQSVIDLVLKMEKAVLEKNTNASNELKQLFTDFKSNLETSTDQELANISTRLKDFSDRLLKDQEAGMNLMRDKLRSIKDGKNADETKIVNDVLAKIPTPEKVVLDTPQEVRNKLEILNGDERLNISAIDGLQELLDELKSRPVKVGGVGGFNYSAMDIHILDNIIPVNSGDNITFTIPQAPNPISSFKLYRSRARQILTEDYTLSGNILTLTTALDPANESLYCDLRI